MRKAFLAPMLFGFLLLAGAVSASSTQQYNKIFLNPFYRSPLTKLTTYTYGIEVNPPDKIGKVISAVINFQIFATSSAQTYSLWIGGKSCNNPTFLSSSGFVIIAFDCSNVINKAGNYTIQIYSDKDSDSATGWLDLTYMNNPRPEMEIKGTEYAAGDMGTVFLQLKNANGEAVTNGNCYASVFYPNQPNSTHAKWLDKAPMMYLAGSNGLYYYDTVMPNTTGVYMVEAECAYEFGAIWHYAPYDVEQKPIRTVIAGTYTGDTFILNDYEDWLYTQCGSGGAKLCEAYYEYNVSGHNITSLDLYYLGESQVANTLYFYAWNWTSGSWVGLPNSLLFHGTSGGGGGYPSGVDEFQSNRIPSLANTIASNGSVRIRTYSLHTSAYNMFDNWLSLKVSVVGAIIQDVKGNGEMHIGAGANNTNAFADLREAIASVNNTVKGGFNQTWANQTTIYDYLVAHNSSVFGKLQSIQADITNADSHLSSLITSVNQTVLATNSSVMNKLFLIQDDLYIINETLNNLNVSVDLTPVLDKLGTMEGEIISVNDTVRSTNSSIFGKLYGIQDDLADIYWLVYASNSSITNKLHGIQDEIAEVNSTQNLNFQELNTNMQNNFTSLNDTVNWWGNQLNTTMNWWGSFLNVTMDFWGNALETKIDNIIMGNVTVTALVDYDEIALTTMQYLKALEKMELI